MRSLASASMAGARLVECSGRAENGL